MPTRRFGTRRITIGLVGLATVLCTPSLQATEDFTIVLLPDTQYYSRYEPTWYTAQTQWIRDNVESENIKFVIHMGDLVDQYGSVTQWQNASNAQAILEGPTPIPHSVMPGNHDFTGSGAPDYTRNTTMYNTYFPRSRYSGQSWFGGTYDSTNDNHYSFFSAGGMDFMVLCLEPVPRQTVVNWANAVVQTHPNHRVILATHMYLDPEGVRQTENAYSYFSGLSAQDLYEQLVYPNPNIFLVTCGHICYEALIPSKNAAGNQVYELLSDYQRKFSDTGDSYGAGWLRTLRFSPDENRITVGSYSPTKDAYDRFYSFALEYDMGGTIAPPPARPQATLTSRWEFETSGVDSVGTNNLTVSGTSTYGAGQLGSGLQFDGVLSDYAYRVATPELAISEAFSGAAWFKYDANNGRLARIFNVKPDESNACNVGFMTGDAATSALVVRVLKDGVAYHVVTEEEVERGAFHHVAFSFDDLAGPTASKKIRVWIDGEEATLAEANHFDGVRGHTGLFLLGRTDDTLIDLLDPHDFPTPQFSGVLDEVRWYDGVLSDAQAAALQFAPVLGDANGDGAVDATDAAVLAEHWLEDTIASFVHGDFNDDGHVDDLDASILAAHWHYGGGGGTRVPEPSALVLLVLAGLTVLGLRRR